MVGLSNQTGLQVLYMTTAVVLGVRSQEASVCQGEQETERGRDDVENNKLTQSEEFH